VIVNTAIGDDEKKFLRFNVDSDDESESTIVDPDGVDILNVTRNGTHISVPQMSLGDLCHRYFYRRPLFISVDIEGFEALAFSAHDWKTPNCRPDIWMV
jgi:FkbM family methyltransferase